MTRMPDDGNVVVIAIGGSAGSLRPLQAICASLPPDLGAAICCVQHTGSGRNSQLAAVLAHSTALPVRAASDGEPIVPGTIFVGSGDGHLVVERGRVRRRWSPRDTGARPSINVLFRSAAAAYGHRAAGVLLSGVLADGVAGLWEIGAAGGVTIVQSPGDASFAHLPGAALRDVPVDHELASGEIGGLLTRLAAPRATWAEAEGRPTVLIVEDDAVQAIDLEDRVRTLGYDVVASVATGEEALVAVAQRLPDVALVDIRLGGALDGIDTATVLTGRFGVGVIFTTSHDDPDTMRRMTAALPSGYLSKPIRSQDLHGAMALALAARA